MGFKNIFLPETNENISIFYPTYDAIEHKPNYLYYPRD